MCTETVPLILLVAAPVALLLHRLGLLQSAVVRYALGALVLGIAITRRPEAGFETADLDRVKLLLSAAATLLLWLGNRDRFALALLAALSVLAHYNFLSFHGRGAYAHEHEIAHYYLGSKYFAEIGYGELYVATIRADAEANGGRPSLLEARDLHANVLVPADRLLAASDPVRARFTDERWRDFGLDLAILRQRLGGRYSEFVKDHGYNPTPVWSLLGGGIASLVPAGSERGIVALTLIDPLLQIAAFAALGLAFGVDVALVAVTYAALLFGASFDWVGGAFLRQLWFSSCLVAFACWQRGAAVPAGALFAVAAALRVFPGFFAAGIAGSVALDLVRRRRPAAGDLRLLAAFAVTGAALFAGTLLLPRGFANWLAFRDNIQAHMSGLMSNFVGAPAWTRYVEAFVVSPGDAVSALPFTGGIVTRGAELALLGLGALIALWIASRHTDPARRAAAGVWPIVLGVKVSAYYSTFLVPLVPAFRDRPERWALLFAVETCLYSLALFERHFVMLCLFRSVLVVYLLIALDLEELRAAIPARLRARTDTEPANG